MFGPRACICSQALMWAQSIWFGEAVCTWGDEHRAVLLKLGLGLHYTVQWREEIGVCKPPPSSPWRRERMYASEVTCPHGHTFFLTQALWFSCQPRGLTFTSAANLSLHADLCLQSTSVSPSSIPLSILTPPPPLPPFLPLSLGLYTDQADFNLVILLSQPPQCWNPRCSLPCPATCALVSGPHPGSRPTLGSLIRHLFRKALSLSWPPCSAAHKGITVVEGPTGSGRFISVDFIYLFAKQKLGGLLCSSPS